MNLSRYIYTPEARFDNLAKYLSDEDLAKIGERVCREAQIDEDSCAEWRERTDPAMDLAMQIWEQKNYPFQNAANIKLPILTQAAIQFQARAYPNIVSGQRVVKCRIVGRDAIQTPQGEWIPGAKTKIAERVSKHMSWQLLEEMEEWTEDLDKSLTALPIVGEDWMKTYFDPVLGRNVSCRKASSNIIINYHSKSTIAPNRITEKLYLYPNEIEEKKRSGYYLDEEIHIDDGDDEDRLHLFYEQHRLLDIDDDGYKEPYIVTVHEKSRKVVRVYPRFEPDGVERVGDRISRIVPEHYYTQRVFFQSPDGGSRGMGFGNLLRPLAEAANTLVNQILDSGSIYNNGGGFLGKGSLPNRGKGHGGEMSFSLNEWKVVNMTGDDLKKAIVPLPAREPSMVLFQLLGYIVDASAKISSVSDVMLGESPGANVPAASTLGLIEQGLKVFSGIYLRIHRALKAEYKKLYRLNSIYLPPMQYFRVLDEENVIHQKDYNITDFDVLPVSNPNEVSDTQKMLKAQALMEVIGAGFNQQEIRRRWLDAMGFEDIENLLLPDEVLSQPPPELELEQRKVALEEGKFQWKMVTDRSKMLKEQAMASKAFAEADEASDRVQLDFIKMQMEALNQEANRVHERALQRLEAKSSSEGTAKGDSQ